MSLIILTTMIMLTILMNLIEATLSMTLTVLMCPYQTSLLMTPNDCNFSYGLYLMFMPEQPVIPLVKIRLLPP